VSTADFTAKAARLVEHGKPLEVAPVELSSPGDDEVQVSLAFGSLNPVDRYVVEGKVAGDGALPRTIGGEAGGHVDGRPVLVAGAGLGSTRDGVFATSAVVPRSAVYELPDDTPLDEAAALGVVGMTTVRVCQVAEVGPGDRVLVLGASGGVGHSVVGYAAALGASVLGQTGSAEKADVVKQLGADDVVVCDARGLADAVRAFEPTVVIDPLGGEFTPAALSALAERGRLVLFGTSAGASATIQLQHLYRGQRQFRTFGGLIATPQERREGITRAIEEHALGRLRIRVGAVLPLDDVNDAFATLGAHSAIGKVVLDLR
jgi:NADPH2:quinone reductase